MYQNPIRANITSVLATEVPIAVDHEIAIYFYNGNSEFPPPVKKGDLAIACIAPDGDNWILDRNGVDFLRNRKSLLVISDMAQSDVKTVISKILEFHEQSIHSKK